MSLLEQESAGRAYLLKERVGEIDDLLHAIREVVAGRSMIDPEIVDLLVTGGHPAESGAPVRNPARWGSPGHHSAGGCAGREH